MVSSTKSRSANFSDPGRTLRSSPETVLSQQMTVSQLLGLLEIQQPDPDSKLRCHGRGTKRKDCANPLNLSARQQISTITQTLAESWCHSNTNLRLLELLSALIMCVHDHQYQAPAKFEIWKSKLTPEPATPQRTRSLTRTPQRPQSSSQDHGAQIPNTNTRNANSFPFPRRSPPEQSRSPASVSTSRRNSVHLELKTVTREQDSPSIKHPANRNEVRPSTAGLRQDTQSLSTHSSRQTRSMTKAAVPLPTATIKASRFELVGKKLPTREAAENLLRKLQSNISPKEFNEGHIYGYRRPGCKLIKIGHTTQTTEKRMHTIETQCHYTPIFVFQFATNHAMRVERLVHKHLHNERRREVLQGSLCNDGRGCSTNHHEWFDVNDERARSVAQIWVDWIQLEPFDERGCLKPVWIQKIKLFDYNSNADIWMTWTRMYVMEPWIKEEEDSKRAVRIKEEKQDSDFEAALEVLRRLRAPSTMPRARIRMVKEEGPRMDRSVGSIPQPIYVGGACA